jgi:hypothetical protein
MSHPEAVDYLSVDDLLDSATRWVILTARSATSSTIRSSLVPRHRTVIVERDTESRAVCLAVPDLPVARTVVQGPLAP